MTATILITRHRGTQEWIESLGLSVGEVISHLGPEKLQSIQPGDWVLGTLPANLAATVCERGARYFYLAIETPPELRGQELTASQLRSYGAYLVEIKAELGEIWR